MRKLAVLENELVPVYGTDTREKVVYGTELHEVLGVKSCLLYTSDAADEL